MTTENLPTSRVWRAGAAWTRSAVDAPPRDWLVLYLHAEAEPMRPTTTQHLRFLEHSLTPHNVLLLERLARRPRLGPLLPVRRRGAPLLGALHALGGAVRALALLARLDRRERRRPHRDAAGRVRLRRDRSTSGWAISTCSACSRCSTPATGPCCIRASRSARAWSAVTPASSTTARPARCSTSRPRTRSATWTSSTAHAISRITSATTGSSSTRSRRSSSRPHAPQDCAPTSRRTSRTRSTATRGSTSLPAAAA